MREGGGVGGVPPHLFGRTLSSLYSISEKNANRERTISILTAGIRDSCYEKILDWENSWTKTSSASHPEDEKEGSRTKHFWAVGKRLVRTAKGA